MNEPNAKTAATASAARKVTRILVVEDHALVRRGIIDMLAHEPDLRVCGEATTGVEALNLFKSEKPDLVLADLTLREGNGIELIREIRALGSRVPILVLSMREETMFAERVIRAGAQGYVGKSAPSERLISAIRQVLRGELALSPDVTERLVTHASGSYLQDDYHLSEAGHRRIAEEIAAPVRDACLAGAVATGSQRAIP